MFKKIFITLVTLIFAGFVSVLYIMISATSMPDPVAIRSESFTLQNMTLITPGISRSRNSAIVVKGGVIDSIDSTSSVQAELLLEYEGGYVLPGLIDMHIHQVGATPFHLSEYFGFLYMSHGITSVRDTGFTPDSSAAKYRAGIERRDFSGPKLFSCGPFVVGWDFGPGSLRVDTLEQVDDVIAQIKNEGYFCMKIHEQMSLRVIRSLVKKGLEAGLSVIGHTPAPYTIEEARIPENQHFTGVIKSEDLSALGDLEREAEWDNVDIERLLEIVAFSVVNDIAHTPTVSKSKILGEFHNYEELIEGPLGNIMPRLFTDVVWHPQTGLPFFRGITEEQSQMLQRALDKKLTLIYELHKAGGKLYMGADSPGIFAPPGRSFMEEFKLFHQSGISLEDVWAIGTWKSAVALQQPRLGRIQTGAPADLLIFDEDPTKSLDAFDSLRAVVIGGRLHDIEDIRSAHDRYQEHIRSFPFELATMTLGAPTIQESFDALYERLAWSRVPQN